MDFPTKIAVASLALQFLVSWVMSLGGLVYIRFWDAPYALAKLHHVNESRDDDPYGPSFVETSSTYYSARRYVFLLPHVVGAVVWWNFYGFQLVPSIRKRYKVLHRYLGRLLMVTAVAQVLSGVGLAHTSHSNIITIVSYFLAVAVMTCIYHAWKYAYFRDFGRHKLWAYRLVGYLQTIALQRVWMLIFISAHMMGYHRLHPGFTDLSKDEIKAIVMNMFDETFVASILQAFLTTEWYLSTQFGGSLDAPGTAFVAWKPQQVVSTAKSKQS